MLQQAVFGGYLDYVKPAQGPWLIAAGLGLVGMLTGDDQDELEESSLRARRWVGAFFDRLGELRRGGVDQPGGLHHV